MSRPASSRSRSRTPALTLPAVLSFLGTTARHQRLSRAWTLELLAERSGLDVRHVQLIEAGAANVTLATLLRLANGLGVTMPELIEPARAAAAAPPPAAPARRRDIDAGRACSERVQRSRLGRDLSQEQLAHKAGLSLGAIQAVESGRKSPTLRTLGAIAGALGVPAWELLTPYDDEQAPALKKKPRAGRK